jgi:probable rRNA maturation factor
MERLFRAASDALPLVLAQTGPHSPVLDELEEIEISFIDDATIAGVHAEFLSDDAPTDVITFEHGEILISTETAIRQAAQGAHSPQRECALYIIHGLIHLNGHDDHTPEEFAAMKRIQESILSEVWPADVPA